MLKAVLMDIDDTLLDFGKCAEQAMRIGQRRRSHVVSFFPRPTL